MPMYIPLTRALRPGCIARSAGTHGGYSFCIRGASRVRQIRCARLAVFWGLQIRPLPRSCSLAWISAGQHSAGFWRSLSGFCESGLQLTPATILYSASLDSERILLSRCQANWGTFLALDVPTSGISLTLICEQ